MKYMILFAVALFSWSVAAQTPPQEESPRRRRGPIRYDTRWDQGEQGAGVGRMMPEEDDRERYRDIERGLGPERERSSSPAFTPDTRWVAPTPSPQPPPDERRRNWIVPTLEGGLGPRLTEEQEEDPSGWGWLADEVSYRSQERVAAWDAESDALASEQSGNVRMESALSPSGLLGAGVVMPLLPLVMEPPDIGSFDTRPHSMPQGGANNATMEQAQAAGSDRAGNAWAIEEQASLTPWSGEGAAFRMPAEVREETESRGWTGRERMAPEQLGAITPADFSSRIIVPQPSFSPVESPATSSSAFPSFHGSSADGLSSLDQRPGSWSIGQSAESSAFFGVGSDQQNWGGSWGGESGWQAGGGSDLMSSHESPGLSRSRNGMRDWDSLSTPVGGGGGSTYRSGWLSDR